MIEHRRWETFTTIEEAAQLIENGDLTFVITVDGTLVSREFRSNSIHEIFRFYRQLFTSDDPSFARLRKAFEKGGRRNVCFRHEILLF